jgi:hypothetical protein
MEEKLLSRVPWAIFPRKRLEINAKCFRQGLAACVTAKESDRKDLELALEREWAANAFSCLSVRTGFDLLLKVSPFVRNIASHTLFGHTITVCICSCHFISIALASRSDATCLIFELFFRFSRFQRAPTFSVLR